MDRRLWRSLEVPILTAAIGLISFATGSMVRDEGRSIDERRRDLRSMPGPSPVTPGIGEPGDDVSRGWSVSLPGPPRSARGLPQNYTLTSAGANGTFEGWQRDLVRYFDCDLIYTDGQFVQSPEGVKRSSNERVLDFLELGTSSTRRRAGRSDLGGPRLRSAGDPVREQPPPHGPEGPRRRRPSRDHGRNARALRRRPRHRYSPKPVSAPRRDSPMDGRGTVVRGGRAEPSRLCGALPLPRRRSLVWGGSLRARRPRRGGRHEPPNRDPGWRRRAGHRSLRRLGPGGPGAAG